MVIELLDSLSRMDIAEAQRGVAELAPLISMLPESANLELVAADGARYCVTISSLRSVVKVASAMSNFQSDDGNPGGDEISPHDAAAILRMSRPTVMRLIEKGLLRSRKVGAHHRLSKSEVVDYGVRQAAVRHQALSNITSISEEFDL